MIRRNIPNSLTILNLLCGAFAAVSLMDGDTIGAQLLIGCSLLFDLLDGALARLLNARSALGKDLDSLADVVSFGFTPSLLLYVLIAETGAVPNWVSYLGFMPLAAAALRLARFNQSSDQSRSFRGLPTPASAIVIMTLPEIILGIPDSSLAFALWGSPAFLIFISLLLSYLMLSNIRLFSLKTSNVSLKHNLHRYLMLIIMGGAIIWQWAFVGLIFLMSYVILSLLFRKRIISEESQ